MYSWYRRGVYFGEEYQKMYPFVLADYVRDYNLLYLVAFKPGIVFIDLHQHFTFGDDYD